MSTRTKSKNIKEETVVETQYPPVIPTKMLKNDQRKQIFKFMLQAREFDLAMLRLYRQGKAFGGVYSQLGNEAVSVASAISLDETDVLFPMHRNVGGHFVFGQNAKVLLQNYLAREGSQMRGTDGTGHYADVEKRIYGNISHLGAMIPVAAGFVLASKMRGEKTVAMTYIGDGGAQVGEVHEALNFASVQKLPLVLIIENNQYAYSTPHTSEYNCAKLSDRALGYGIHGETVDGTDAERVYEACSNAVKRARNGEGPSIIETVTMRMRGHAEHDDFSYVPKELLEYWAKRDPVERYQQFILSQKIMTLEEIESLRKELSTELFEAIDWAVALPFPPAEEGFKNVFL